MCIVMLRRNSRSTCVDRQGVREEGNRWPQSARHHWFLQRGMSTRFEAKTKHKFNRPHTRTGSRSRCSTLSRSPVRHAGKGEDITRRCPMRMDFARLGQDHGMQTTFSLATRPTPSLQYEQRKRKTPQSVCVRLGGSIHIPRVQISIRQQPPWPHPPSSLSPSHHPVSAARNAFNNHAWREAQS